MSSIDKTAFPERYKLVEKRFLALCENSDIESDQHPDKIKVQRSAKKPFPRKASNLLKWYWETIKPAAYKKEKVLRRLLPTLAPLSLLLIPYFLISDYAPVEEEFLWKYLCIGAGFAGFIYLLNKALKQLGYEHQPLLGSTFKKLLEWAFRKPEVLKKFGISLLLSLIIPVLGVIPLPGTDVEKYRTWARNLGNLPQMLSEIVPILTARQISVGVLGLGPFLSACGIILLISLVLPPLRNILFSGESGRFKISRYVFVLTFLLCLSQGWVVCKYLFSSYYGIFGVDVSYNWLYISIGMCLISCAVFVYIGIALLINRFGIGNGFAWVLLTSLPLYILRLFRTAFLTGNEMLRLVSPGSVLLTLVFTAGMVYVIFFFVNRKSILCSVHAGSGKEKMAIPSSIVAGNPAAAALSLVFLVLLVWDHLSFYTVNYYFLYFLMFLIVYPVALLYMRIVFHTEHVLDLAELTGAIRSSDTREQAKKNIHNNLRITTFLICVFYGIIRFVPNYLFGEKLPSIRFSLTGSLSVLCLTGFLIDLLKQVEFYKHIDESNTKDWVECYTGFGSLETELKAGYVQSKGIMAFIKPYRFSWMVPARTLVDKYPIYVPKEKRDEARKLLLELDEKVQQK